MESIFFQFMSYKVYHKLINNKENENYLLRLKGYDIPLSFT